MRKIRVINGLYSKPECNVLSIEVKTNLLERSVGGGHKDADDDEGLSPRRRRTKLQARQLL